jgi:hypothetical protein
MQGSCHHITIIASSSETIYEHEEGKEHAYALKGRWGAFEEFFSQVQNEAYGGRNAKKKPRGGRQRETQSRLHAEHWIHRWQTTPNNLNTIKIYPNKALYNCS